jgi:hypothetical protein
VSRKARVRPRKAQRLRAGIEPEIRNQKRPGFSVRSDLRLLTSDL